MWKEYGARTSNGKVRGLSLRNALPTEATAPAVCLSLVPQYGRELDAEHPSRRGRAFRSDNVVTRLGRHAERLASELDDLAALNSERDGGDRRAGGLPIEDQIVIDVAREPSRGKRVRERRSHRERADRRAIRVSREEDRILEHASDHEVLDAGVDDGQRRTRLPFPGAVATDTVSLSSCSWPAP